MENTYNKKFVIDKLLGMREQFKKELENVDKTDDEAVLILKFKIVTVGQILDKLKYDDSVENSVNESIDNSYIYNYINE